MASRPAMIKRSKKIVRKTRSEQYLVNVKYLGIEPDATQIANNQMRSINWFNAMCGKDEAREFLSTYLAAQDRQAELKMLSKVSDTWLPLGACWLSRMAMIAPMAAQVNDWDATIMRYLNISFKHVESDKPEAVLIPKASVQDRVRSREHDIIGDIEELIDKGEEFSLYDWLKRNEIPAMYAAKIVEHYKPWLSELVEAYSGKDSQLNEGYKSLGKKGLKERIAFFSKMLEDADKYGNVTKKTRAPRKPRPVSAEKMLKYFKYQKESSEYKIASINPEKIIGAQELWTFNTKYKIITVFRALDRGGLQVKGTSIIGYDEKTSFSKGAGRKPEIYLDKIANSGKLILKKLMDEMKTDKGLQHRINENTVLMKVVS